MSKCDKSYPWCFKLKLELGHDSIVACVLNCGDSGDNLDEIVHAIVFVSCRLIFGAE